MTTPRLWSWNLSPFAGRVRVAAAVKGVELDLIEIDPLKRPPRLRELNPTNRVPVLEIGDADSPVVVRESTAICEWLEEVGDGPSLWPQDVNARAAARGLTRWVDDELTVNFFLSFRKEAFGPDASEPPDIVDVLRGRLMRRWPVLDELLGRTDGPWLMAGDQATLADLSAMPLAVRVVQWGPQLAPAAELTRATAWLDALRAHPLVDEVKRRGRDAAEL
jgi:glutathione S-transferase